LQIPDILKVIYAPHKAFKEIAEKPTYLGPILILILFLAANVGFAYVAVSKTYIEMSVPSGLNLDEWTENSTLWTSNAVITESNDNINGSYFGNRSIAFSISNSAELWTQLKNIGPINCFSQDGYSVASFRVKQISPNENPQNVSAYLFSGDSPVDYFFGDLTQRFSNSTNGVWNNLTISLASGWTGSGPNADWGNITGLRLEFRWAGSSSVSLLVDGLFFRGVYKSLLETAGSTYLLNFLVTGAMQFVVTWVVLGGLLYLLSKTLGAKLVWRILLIVIGSILVTMFVQALVNIAAYSTLSNVKYPFELLSNVPSEGQASYDAIVEQTSLVTLIGRITQIVVYVWTITLSALAVHLVGGLGWTKSFLAATVAYLATIFISGFLFG
jgi:energy-coupling factor transporter transmembrane protein EcfT